MITKDDFTRVNNDVNGNPRYVCHFLNLVTKADDGLSVLQKYDAAVNRARKFGGKAYRGKAYGGGIVFTSYNLEDEINFINGLQ